LKAINRANRPLRIVVDAFSPTGWRLDTPPNCSSHRLPDERRPGFVERETLGGLTTRPFGRVFDDPPAGHVDNPPSLNLFLADGVGNLRDPRVGNIMTLDIVAFH
jgi:hypothetical protein